VKEWKKSVKSAEENTYSEVVALKGKQSSLPAQEEHGLLLREGEGQRCSGTADVGLCLYPCAIAGVNALDCLKLEPMSSRHCERSVSNYLSVAIFYFFSMNTGEFCNQNPSKLINKKKTSNQKTNPKQKAQLEKKQTKNPDNRKQAIAFSALLGGGASTMELRIFCVGFVGCCSMCPHQRACGRLAESLG